MPFSGVLTKLNEPSDYATTDLPEKGDRPGSGSIELIMADVVSQKRLGSASTTESYAKSPACATSANSRWWNRVQSIIGVLRISRVSDTPFFLVKFSARQRRFFAEFNIGVSDHF